MKAQNCPLCGAKENFYGDDYAGCQNRDCPFYENTATDHVFRIHIDIWNRLRIAPDDKPLEQTVHVKMDKESMFKAECDGYVKYEEWMSPDYPKETE